MYAYFDLVFFLYKSQFIHDVASFCFFFVQMVRVVCGSITIDSYEIFTIWSSITIKEEIDFNKNCSTIFVNTSF